MTRWSLGVGMAVWLAGCAEEPLVVPMDGPAVVYDLPAAGRFVDTDPEHVVVDASPDEVQGVVLTWTVRSFSPQGWMRTSGAIGVPMAPLVIGDALRGGSGDDWSVESAADPDSERAFAEGLYNGTAVHLEVREDSAGDAVVEVVIDLETEDVVLVLPAPAGLLEPVDRN